MFQQFLVQPLANGLVLFYRLFGNMGLAIIFFSAALKIVLSPLSAKSMQNMKKMNELKPLLNKLQKKYKGDKQGLMKAQADLYKQKGFNPTAGCIPQIIQIVILYAFFGVFNILVRNGDVVSAFNNILYEPLKFAGGEMINTHFLYLDITKPDAIQIPGVPFPLPGPILIFATIAQFLSIRITSPVLQKEEKITKKTETSTDDAMVASQQYMLYMMPLLTLIIGLQFASGLALYWVVFSLIQAYQQYRVTGWGGLDPWVKKLSALANLR